MHYLGGSSLEDLSNLRRRWTPPSVVHVTTDHSVVFGSSLSHYIPRDVLRTGNSPRDSTAPFSLSVHTATKAAEMRHVVEKTRSSTDRKRSSSRSEGFDLDAKRRVVGQSTPSKSDHGGVHTTSYPISSLYPKDMDYRPVRRDLMERSIEEGYPGQYDLRENSYVQQSGEMCRRSYELDTPLVPSYTPPRTKANRFNLSRYQLDADDDFVPASEPEEKPNRFKTQRERLILASQDASETSLSLDDADSSSESQSQSQDDSCMSQRERLRRFSSEHSRHVVIPNEWQGETELQEFVALGNIEAALRPLGLMMARAALVSDSVNPRHPRGVASSGPSGCHTTLSNPWKSAV